MPNDNSSGSRLVRTLSIVGAIVAVPLVIAAAVGIASMLFSITLGLAAALLVAVFSGSSLVWILCPDRAQRALDRAGVPIDLDGIFNRTPAAEVLRDRNGDVIKDAVVLGETPPRPRGRRSS